MKCVILQPSYIPWRGYFHQIYKSDLFIFYDDVQYDKEGWRNRNTIKTAQGLQWLTIPVHAKGVVEENIPIKDIEICWDKPWNDHHWKGLQFAYSKAPHFERFRDYFRNLYNQKPHLLAEFTIQTTIQIANLIGIRHVQYERSSEIKGIKGEKTDRIIQILKAVGASHYISGPSAKNYLEEEKFEENNIELEYVIYDYPEYPQLFPPFDPQVSILDLLFNTGRDALSYIV